jgi:3-hydroxyisobutyrate dehydrogenase-like beta-hydroxyacid dehydrogenase
MALRVAAAGHDVLVVEAMPLRRNAARDAGLEVVEVERVSEADVVIAMVATADQLDGVLSGDGGAFASMSSGSICVVMSTVGPAAAEKVAAAAAEHGISVLDVPVTGGVTGAESGTLTLLAAGDPEVLAATTPVLSPLGSIFRCGNRIGDGQSFKLVNQLLCSVHLTAAAEALAFADRLGLDPSVVLDAVRSGAGGSWMLDDRGPRMVHDDMAPITTVDIFVKDSALAAEAAADVGFDAPLLVVARDAFGTATAMGYGRDDDSRVRRAYDG